MKWMKEEEKNKRLTLCITLCVIGLIASLSVMIINQNEFLASFLALIIYGIPVPTIMIIDLIKDIIKGLKQK